MSAALDKVRRGVDSSGRPLIATRQHWQFFDRVSERIGGKLVPVQGGWSFAAASGNTHGLAMCMDFRTWNLTAAEIEIATRYGRDLGGTMWYRTWADGFDPHFHNNLMGDSPATFAALAQIPSYRAGRNGLLNQHQDRNPYRPKIIRPYKYIEDDMFTQEDHERLKRLEKSFNTFRRNEVRRDAKEREKDKARFSKAVTMLGQQADLLGRLASQATDQTVKAELLAARKATLQTLADDPDVTGVDNPSPEALADEA